MKSIDWQKALPQARFLGNTNVLAGKSFFFIDSRLVKDWQKEKLLTSVFIPLKGERFDGHDFVNDVLSQGIAVSLCEEKNIDKIASLLKKYPQACLVVVDEALQALQALASWHISRMNVCVIGITGSNGKTTTKEMMANVLKQSAKTFYSKGNFNSIVGLPLMVLQIEDHHQFAVLEMGIDCEGEMDILAKIARPFLSIITNVGTAHIGIFGDRDKIALEKKKIFSLSDEHVVLPADDSCLPILRQGIKGRVHLFGLQYSPITQVQDRGCSGSSFYWRDKEIHLNIPGMHNVRNALAVLTACEVLDIDLDLARKGLQAVTASFGRSQLLHGRISVLRDCYNANPESVGGLLQMVQSWKEYPRRVFVLGSMKALGKQSQLFHQELGRMAASLNAEAIFFFGEETQAACEACRQLNFSGHVEWTQDYKELEESVKNFVRDGDLVVLKGSRSMELERLSSLWFEE